MKCQVRKAHASYRVCPGCLATIRADGEEAKYGVPRRGEVLLRRKESVKEFNRRVDRGDSRQQLADWRGITLEGMYQTWSNWRKAGLNPRPLPEAPKKLPKVAIPAPTARAIKPGVDCDCEEICRCRKCPICKKAYHRDRTARYRERLKAKQENMPS